jgi:hypothetical protein
MKCRIHVELEFSRPVGRELGLTHDVSVLAFSRIVELPFMPFKGVVLWLNNGNLATADDPLDGLTVDYISWDEERPDELYVDTERCQGFDVEPGLMQSGIIDWMEAQGFRWDDIPAAST